jgi:hypothetical protein
VALGPAQVHAEEHLGPVGGFGAARTRADRQHGVALVVLATEQQLSPCPLVFAGELLGVLDDVGKERLVVFRLSQIQEFDGRLRSRFETLPQAELVAQAFGLAQDPLGSALVVPEAGLADARVQVD